MFKVPKSIPFWMFDRKNFQLIISRSVPTSINDSKSIVYAEIAVPGGGHSDNVFASMGAEEASFSLRVVNFNNSLGNSLLLAQYRNLRTPGGVLDIAFLNSRQFNPNPSVLMWWGTGKFAPLVYKVVDVQFNHQNHNRFGFPQVTDVSMKFRLDHEGLLFKLEDLFMKVGSFAGMADSMVKMFGSRHPYKGLF